MAAPALSLDIRGLLDAKQRLQLLALPPTKRRRVLSKASDRLAVHNRQRIRTERNLDGSAFAPRKGGGKRKLLRGLGKALTRVSTTATEAVLGWKRRSMSRIASEHQSAHSQTMTAARMRRMGKSQDYAAPASRQQARSLIKAGYRIRNGKRWRRPSQSWIVQHLTYGQAGLIVAQLAGVRKKQRWNIELPARHVLGADTHAARDMLSTVLQQTLNAPQ